MIKSAGELFEAGNKIEFSYRNIISLIQDKGAT